MSFVSGNQAPAPGSLAALIAVLQAPNPFKNVTRDVAQRYADLYNSLGQPAAAVKQIVVIQQPQPNVPDGADVLPLSTVQSFGIGADVPLYYHLDRGEDDVKDMECVGDSVRLVNSVGIDADGKKNVFQAFQNLVQAIEPGITSEEVTNLLYNQKPVRDAAYDFLNKFLGA